MDCLGVFGEMSGVFVRVSVVVSVIMVGSFGYVLGP